MNKAIVVIGDTRVEEENGVVALLYTVTVIGDVHGRYSSEHILDLNSSLRENLQNLIEKLTTYVFSAYGLRLSHAGDIIIFGAPFVDSTEALHCCAHGMTSVNRSLSGKLIGFGSMMKSFFTPSDPVVQVVQEKDSRVDEHAKKLQELEGWIDSVKSEILLVQEELKTLIIKHDHAYPDRAIRLEGEVNTVLGKLHQHHEHIIELYEKVIQRIHVLENPPPKEEPIPEVIKERVEEEAKEVIEEVTPVVEKPVEEVKGVWQRFERWVQNLWV